MEHARAKICCWLCILRGQGRGNTIRSIDGLEEAQEKVRGMVVAANLPSVGQLRSEHYEEMVGSSFGTHKLQASSKG